MGDADWFDDYVTEYHRIYPPTHKTYKRMNSNRGKQSIDEVNAKKTKETISLRPQNIESLYNRLRRDISN